MYWKFQTPKQSILNLRMHSAYVMFEYICTCIYLYTYKFILHEQKLMKYISFLYFKRENENLKVLIPIFWFLHFSK